MNISVRRARTHTNRAALATETVKRGRPTTNCTPISLLGKRGGKIRAMQRTTEAADVDLTFVVFLLSKMCFTTSEQ